MTFEQGGSEADNAGPAPGWSLGQLAADTRSAEVREVFQEASRLRELTDSLAGYIRVWEASGQDGNAAIAGDESLTPQSRERSDLLDILRVLRNMCASGPTTIAALIQRGVHNRAAKLMQSTGDPQVAKVAVQLLANMSTGEGHCIMDLWSACWPEACFHVVDRHAAHISGPLSMLLVNCLKQSPQLAGTLTTLKGASIVGPLLRQLPGIQEPGERQDVNLERVACHFCFRAGSIPGLAGPWITGTLLPPITLPPSEDWHAGVLHALTEGLQAPQEFLLPGTVGAMGAHLAASILDLADTLARRRNRCDAPCQQAVLHEAMRFARTLTAMDDGGACIFDGRSVVEALRMESFLVKRLLSMLAALGPIKSRRPDKQPVQDWPVNSELGPEKYVEQQPYRGYRSDVVAVLANLCYMRPAVQNEMERLGGVELILAHCQVDDESPFLREVALWGVRNLCEGNPSIQKRIEELQVVGTVDTPELQSAGVAIEHDPASGKIRMIDRINE